MMTTESSSPFDRACRVLPGGVNSPVRSFGAVGGVPRFITSAAGCRVTDTGGRQYIDYVGSWGPLIAGHAHPVVVDAVSRAAAAGLSFGMPTPGETALAETVIQRMPAIEMLRLVNSGTEAVMSAIRVARAWTRRRRIITFAGCYHGHCDSLLVSAGSGIATLGLPDSSGVTPGATQDTVVLPFNDRAAVRALFQDSGSDVAAVLVEPVAGNMGVVPPAHGFLEALREVTRAHGALLIFDEVMTGFRVDRGGATGRYAVTPDLITLGKILGGGLPVGAYGGARSIMNQVAPAGPVYQAGTLSGNPLTSAAGLATLSLLDENAYDRLEQRSAALADGLSAALLTRGIAGVVQRVGSMLTLFFGVTQVANFADAQAADHAMFARFFTALLESGIHLPPSGYEAWFVSLAHQEGDIERTIQAARAAMERAAARPR